MSKRYLWQDLRDWLQLHYAERFARCELFVNPAADGTGPQGYYKLDFSGVLLNYGSPIRHDIETMAVSYAVAWYAGHNSVQAPGKVVKLLLPREPHKAHVFVTLCVGENADKLTDEHVGIMQEGLNQLSENTEYWRTHFHYCSYCGHVASGGPRPGCPFGRVPAKPDVDWILCSDQLPPYDEPVWLTVCSQNCMRGWEVVFGYRQCTDASGETWRDVNRVHLLANDVFSWRRTINLREAPDPRAATSRGQR